MRYNKGDILILFHPLRSSNGIAVNFPVCSNKSINYEIGP